METGTAEMTVSASLFSPESDVKSNEEHPLEFRLPTPQAFRPSHGLKTDQIKPIAYCRIVILRTSSNAPACKRYKYTPLTTRSPRQSRPSQAA